MFRISKGQRRSKVKIATHSRPFSYNGSALYSSSTLLRLGKTT